MKNSKGYVDLGTIFDEIFEAARNFSDEFHRNFDQFGNGYSPNGPFGARSPFGQRSPFDENIDYYPNYSYPPMNVYMTGDRSMNFEFALAGFDEKDISLSFQGDYMVFSAKIGDSWGNSSGGETCGHANSAEDPQGSYGNTGAYPADENIRYFKRRLKLKDIEKQKYFVPLDKYAQEKVKAVYKNGILKVVIPPKDEPDQNDGVKIEILKEGD